MIREQQFAIVRVDHYRTPRAFESMTADDLNNAITIVEVVPTLEEAKHEVARLNELNGGKGAVYFWQTTKVFPEGRGFVPSS